jgi:hypothetical protein
VRVGLSDRGDSHGHLAPLALPAGILSVLSIPVTVRGDVGAPLNLYSDESFRPDSQPAAAILAAQTGMAIVRAGIPSAGGRAHLHPDTAQDAELVDRSLNPARRLLTTTLAPDRSLFDAAARIAGSQSKPASIDQSSR